MEGKTWFFFFSFNPNERRDAESGSCCRLLLAGLKAFWVRKSIWCATEYVWELWPPSSPTMTGNKRGTASSGPACAYFPQHCWNSGLGLQSVSEEDTWKWRWGHLGRGERLSGRDCNESNGKNWQRPITARSDSLNHASWQDQSRDKSTNNRMSPL